MKNVSLIESSTNKIKSWKLLNNNSEAIESFTIFSNLLIKKYSLNTRLSYCRNVALFIDYIEEAAELFKDKNFTKSFLVNIIESFPDWLMFGESSGNEITLTVHKNYSSPIYSKQTIDLIMASVRLFLSVSERIRIEQENNGEFTDSKLINNINTKNIISKQTRNKLIDKSMLAGVISGGPQLLKACILPIPKSQPYFSIERAFPFDKIISLIEAFPTYRDKALYMFAAASGCRIHEALQILIEDIDIKNRSVRLIDPNSRITHSTYKALTPEERNRLSWKGRQIDRTVLIQPFGDLFFEYLEQYIKNEYVVHNKHSFVFQHVRGKNKGKPFFLSATSTRNEAFEKAVITIGLDLKLIQGVHS
jgi:integrase